MASCRRLLVVTLLFMQVILLVKSISPSELLKKKTISTLKRRDDILQNFKLLAGGHLLDSPLYDHLLKRFNLLPAGIKLTQPPLKGQEALAQLPFAILGNDKKKKSHKHDGLASLAAAAVLPFAAGFGTFGKDKKKKFHKHDGLASLAAAAVLPFAAGFGSFDKHKKKKFHKHDGFASLAASAALPFTDALKLLTPPVVATTPKLPLPFPVLLPEIKPQVNIRAHFASDSLPQFDSQIVVEKHYGPPNLPPVLAPLEPQYGISPVLPPLEPQYGPPPVLPPLEPQYGPPPVFPPLEPQYGPLPVFPPLEPQYGPPPVLSPPEPHYGAPPEPQYGAPPQFHKANSLYGESHIHVHEPVSLYGASPGHVAQPKPSLEKFHQLRLELQSQFELPRFLTELLPPHELIPKVFNEVKQLSNSFRQYHSLPHPQLSASLDVNKSPKEFRVTTKKSFSNPDIAELQLGSRIPQITKTNTDQISLPYRNPAVNIGPVVFKSSHAAIDGNRISELKKVSDELASIADGLTNLLLLQHDPTLNGVDPRDFTDQPLQFVNPSDVHNVRQFNLPSDHSNGLPSDLDFDIRRLFTEGSVDPHTSAHTIAPQQSFSEVETSVEGIQSNFHNADTRVKSFLVNLPSESLSFGSDPNSRSESLERVDFGHRSPAIGDVISVSSHIDEFGEDSRPYVKSDSLQNFDQLSHLEKSDSRGHTEIQRPLLSDSIIGLDFSQHSPSEVKLAHTENHKSSIPLFASDTKHGDHDTIILPLVSNDPEHILSTPIHGANDGFSLMDVLQQEEIEQHPLQEQSVEVVQSRSDQRTTIAAPVSIVTEPVITIIDLKDVNVDSEDPLPNLIKSLDLELPKPARLRRSAPSTKSDNISNVTENFIVSTTKFSYGTLKRHRVLSFLNKFKKPTANESVTEYFAVGSYSGKFVPATGSSDPAFVLTYSEQRVHTLGLCSVSLPEVKTKTAGCGHHVVSPGDRFNLVPDRMPCVWRLRHTADKFNVNLGAIPSEMNLTVSEETRYVANRFLKGSATNAGTTFVDLVFTLSNAKMSNHTSIEICIPGDAYTQYDKYNFYCCSSVTHSFCGFPTGSPYELPGPSVVPGRFPWQALLFIRATNVNTGNPQGDYVTCTGVLVSEKWVLTKASCFFEAKLGARSLIPHITVYFGITSTNVDTYQHHEGEELVIYPTFSKFHDIALVRLKTPIRRYPICLPPYLKPTINKYIINKNASVVGWTLKDDRKLGEVMVSKHRVLDSEECSRLRGSQLPPHTICTTDKQPGYPCLYNGILMEYPGRYYVRGLPSLLTPCEEDLGVYTSVAHFMPWIANVTGIQVPWTK